MEGVGYPLHLGQRRRAGLVQTGAQVGPYHISMVARADDAEDAIHLLFQGDKAPVKTPCPLVGPVL